MKAGDSGFFEAILTDPDGDATRLVYADWLEENGQPGRAEFIRAQCALDSAGADDDIAAGLRGRQDELLDEHEMAWRAELPRLDGVDWVGFRRGFVEDVAVHDV